MTRQHLPLVACLLLGATAQAGDEPIRIVRGYEGMARYADAASYSDPTSYATLFDRHVYQRYESQCGGFGPQREISRAWLRSPIRDIDALQASLEKIRQSDVDEWVRDAAERASNLLPGGPVTICIFPYPPDIGTSAFVADVMGGAMGFSDASGSFWLQLLPVDGWLDEIHPAVTHEYYHAVSFPSEGEPLTLLDVLIGEGAADSFTAILYPDYVPFWTNALSLEQQTEVWHEMQLVLDTTDRAMIDRYVFGDGDTVPRQAGYTIGFDIVQAWLERNPDVPPAEWSRLSPRTILEGSGYAP